MLDHGARQGVRRLAESVLSVRPLVDVLERPVTVAPEGARIEPPAVTFLGARELLNRVASRVGAPYFEVLPAHDADQLDAFGRVVSSRLDFRDPVDRIACAATAEIDAIVDDTVTASFEARHRHGTVRRADGVALPVYTAGDPRNPALIIASACGMPARLCQRWIDHFAPDYFVITWESRGLFADLDEFVGHTGVQAQAEDLFAVLDHIGVRASGLIGLCGGAVIALAAARLHPDRITSLSLWHGDFELGEQVPKTPHQQNLQALMLMATDRRVSAAAIHVVLCQSMLTNVPPDLAHLVLYPYATPELLFRYCQLNGAIMTTDVRPYLDGLRHKTLVVTSQDDTTAHPAGSRLVAGRVRNATLSVLDHGDHLSLFKAEPHVLRLAEEFYDNSIRFAVGEGDAATTVAESDLPADGPRKRGSAWTN